MGWLDGMGDTIGGVMSQGTPRGPGVRGEGNPNQGGGAGDSGFRPRHSVTPLPRPAPISTGAPRPPVAMTPPTQMMTGGQMPFAMSPAIQALLQRFFGGGMQMPVAQQPLGGMMNPMGGPSLPPEQRGGV